MHLAFFHYLNIKSRNKKSLLFAIKNIEQALFIVIQTFSLFNFTVSRRRKHKMKHKKKHKEDKDRKHKESEVC